MRLDRHHYLFNTLREDMDYLYYKDEAHSIINQNAIVIEPNYPM